MFHKGPLILGYALVMSMIYFSQFFTSFFIGLARIFLNLVLLICSLVVGIDYIVWLINRKSNKSYILLNEKMKAALLSSI